MVEREVRHVNEAVPDAITSPVLCSCRPCCYTITVDPAGLCRGHGYWSVTVYDLEDRYLIPNPVGRYGVSSYSVVPNDDGTCTVRINPDGSGENAIPTMRRSVYAILRVYEPAGTVVFPPIIAV
jgi:hypothetical protein